LALTFSEVYPIVRKSLSTSAFSKAYFDTFYLLNPLSNMLIDSTPAPIPISMIPALILDAMIEQL